MRKGDLKMARQIAVAASVNGSRRLLERYGIDAYPPDVLERGAQAMAAQSKKDDQIHAIAAVLGEWENKQPLTPEAAEWERMINAAVDDGRLPVEFRS